MKLQVPPGRMGTIWLRERLVIASRAREVLEEKLEALTQERHELLTELQEREADWRRLLSEAEQALRSAELVGGIAQVERVMALTQPADTAVTRGRTLGVAHPTSVRVVTPAPLAATWAETSALSVATALYREALRAGARYATTRRAEEVIQRERTRTVRRLRSIERRWMPELAAELHRASRALDEAERADTVRINWVARRGG